MLNLSITKNIRGDNMGYKGSREAAAEIYHSNFEHVHQVCEDFQKNNSFESLNKIMHLIGHLHSVGGAQYQYGKDAEYPEIWLMSNGKTILTQLIDEAQANKLETAAKSLKNICSQLEDSSLV